MKESYVEGSSAPPRPRVMAACPQGPDASVDRGTRRPAIELRNHPFGTPTSLSGREGNTIRDDSASRVIGPAESKTLSMRESSVPENREIPAAPAAGRKPWKGRSGKACGHNPDVYAAGKSDRPIVPRKLPNKAGAAASGAEEVAARGPGQGEDSSPKPGMVQSAQVSR